MNKVQLTLTDQEATILSEYGSQLGYGLTKTIKFLIGKETEKQLAEKMPTFIMSEEQEKKGMQALEEHRQGKTISSEEFFSR